MGSEESWDKENVGKVKKTLPGLCNKTTATSVASRKPIN